MLASKSGHNLEKVTASRHFSEKSLITHEQLKNIMEDRLNYKKIKFFEVSCKSFDGISNIPHCLEQKFNLPPDVIPPPCSEISKINHLELPGSKVLQSHPSIKYEPSSFEVTHKHLQISRYHNGKKLICKHSNSQTVSLFGEHQNLLEDKVIGISPSTKIDGNRILTSDNLMHDNTGGHNHIPITISDSLTNEQMKMASGDTIKSDAEFLEDILFLDCRSFLSYNVSHIKTAQNVHFPSILQRRCKKKITETIIKCCTNNATIANEHDVDMVSPLDKAITEKYQRTFEDSINCANTTENQTTKCLLEFSQHSLPPLLSIASSQNPLIPLESIVTCDRWRKRLLSGDFGLIVIYDEHSEDSQTCFTKNQQDGFSEKLILVLNTLSSLLPQKQLSKLRCLQGGYSTFAQHHPQLIEKQELDFERFPPSQSARIDSPEKDRIKWIAHTDKGCPTEILPWLFLGSSYHADQTDRLLDIGITALLNVASSEVKETLGEEERDSLSSSGMQQLTFQHACIPIVDSLTSEIGCHFQSAIEFIEKVHQNNGKVLVHCSAGVSRSPAVCLAYLISAFSYCLEDAYEFLRSKRACIAPNLNFMRQLQEFEKRHTSKNTISSINELKINEARNKSCITSSKISPAFGSSFCYSAQNQALDHDEGRTDSLIKFVGPFKRAKQKKKDKLAATFASLYLKNNEKDRSLKTIQHTINNMLLQTYKKHGNEIRMTRKLYLYLLSLLTSTQVRSTLPIILKNSQFFKNFLTQPLLEDVEHPMKSSLLDVNIKKRSNRKFLMLGKDFKETKICYIGKKGAIKIQGMADQHCTDSQRNEDKELCDCFALQ